MKKIFTAILLLLIQQCIFAQDKLLSMEDAMLKARTSLAPQNLHSCNSMAIPTIMCTSKKWREKIYG